MTTALSASSQNTDATPPVRALHHKLAAEALGTCVLIVAVIGSGIMAQELSTDIGVQLTMNMLSTVFTLGLLIWGFGPTSGAHFNPVVSLFAAWTGLIRWKDAAAYLPAQIIGGITGAAIANAMFDLTVLHISTKDRTATHLWLGEVVATAGLILVIAVLVRRGEDRLAGLLVPARIGGAYIFTSSTSFANPAVTIARMFSDTFAGIQPASAPAFIVAQCVGLLVALVLLAYFAPATAQRD